MFNLETGLGSSFYEPREVTRKVLCVCVCAFLWEGLPSFRQILRGVPDSQEVKDWWSVSAAAHFVSVAWPAFPIVDGTSLEDCLVNHSYCPFFHLFF